MSVILVLLPLISSIICGLLNKHLTHKAASQIACSFIIISAMLAMDIFVSYCLGKGHDSTVLLAEWFYINGFVVNWVIHVDQLTAAMFMIVTLVSAVVHIYSIGYMHDDENLPRFMSYLSLFTFCMLMLVASDNFIQLFFGWEGVGLCSYLLIGFWYSKPAPCAASVKAFVVNRVGDCAFILGIISIIYYCGSVNFKDVFSHADTLSAINVLDLRFSALDLICLLLFIGAMGKSAQIGLHVWLPDAMEGPTPVSALIHAATMVTAGVFLVVRCSFLFDNSPVILQFIACVGAVTCLFAATIALMQDDIKKIIAYSTCSQLGYMFIACGVSAYEAAIFHLVTHAFFKAMLFLCAGSVIHATHEQDIRKLGGLRKTMPYTYLFFWIGSLAIIGIFPFAGYYSKDLILDSAFASRVFVGDSVFIFGVIAAFFTACYSVKIIVLVFHGESRLSDHDMSHAHESPMVMLAPLSLLALGALCSGAYGHYFLHIGSNAGYFGASIVDNVQHAHAEALYIQFLPLCIGLLGMFFMFVVLGRSYREAAELNWIQRLVKQKYYFDEIYDMTVVKGVHLLSIASAYIDKQIIDRYGPGAAVDSVTQLSAITRKVQNGYIFSYALCIMLGIITIMSVLLVQYINQT